MLHLENSDIFYTMTNAGYKIIQGVKSFFFKINSGYSVKIHTVDRHET